MVLRLPLRTIKPSSLRFYSTSHVPRTYEETTTYELVETPPYPYGPSKWYKQSNHGLYGGLRIRAGNNVSKKTETTTRRVWKPNIHKQEVYSKALDRKIRMKVAVRVLRTIKKVGGLDEYVLGEKTARIKELGPMGWKLRWAIMQTESVRMKMGEEAERIGVSAEKRFERGWMTRKAMAQFLMDSKGLTVDKAEEKATEVENSNVQAAAEAESAVAEEEAKDEEFAEDVPPAGVEEDTIANPAFQAENPIVTEEHVEDFPVEAAASSATIARKAIADLMNSLPQESASTKKPESELLDESMSLAGPESELLDNVKASKSTENPESEVLNEVKESTSTEEPESESLDEVEELGPEVPSEIKRRIEDIWLEQKRRALPIVRKMHDFGGRRGQRLQKHALAVCREVVRHVPVHEETVQESNPPEGAEPQLADAATADSIKEESAAHPKDAVKRAESS